MPEENPVDQNHIFPENPDTPHQSNYVPMISPDDDALTESNNNTALNHDIPISVQTMGQQQPVYPQPDQNQMSPTVINSQPSNNYNNNTQVFDGQQQFPQQQTQYYPQPQLGQVNPNTPTQNPYFQTGPGPQDGQPKPPNSKKPLFDKQQFKKITDWMLAKWWLVLILVLGIAVAFVGLYVYLNQPKPVTGAFNKLDAVIDAPQTSPSGSPARWKITLTNNEAVSLQNITVSLNFDRTFKFTQAINPDPSKPDGSEFKIARLDATGQGSSVIIIQFEGTLTGNIDEETLMQGTVTFTPTPLLSQTNSQRTVQIQAAKTKITQPQIKVSVLPTQDSVQNGGEAEVNVVFQNTSERDLKDIRIRMIYPEQGAFSYVSSQLQIADTNDPKTKPDDGNNIWYVPSLPRLKEQTLKIVGRVFGADGIKVTFGVNIDMKTSSNDYVTLTQSSKDVTVVSQPLVISTRIENKETDRQFAPGDTLNFVIDYKNQSTTVLRAVEILASIDDPGNILDYTTTAFTGGDRGGVANRSIQWKGTNVPKLVNLSPQDGGQLRYTIRVSDADTFIKSGLTQNTYVVTPKVSAKAQNLQPVDYAGELYKAKGLMTFEQSIVSKGLDPTNKNRETFAVTWTIKSRQTAINDVTISTKSPLVTPWAQASISPATLATQISYNDVTGDIIWKPGKILAYTGLNNNAAVSITFNLIVEAQEGQNTKGVNMFSSPKVTGVDDFTGEKYSLTGQQGVSQ